MGRRLVDVLAQRQVPRDHHQRGRPSRSSRSTRRRPASPVALPSVPNGGMTFVRFARSETKAALSVARRSLPEQSLRARPRHEEADQADRLAQRADRCRGSRRRAGGALQGARRHDRSPTFCGSRIRRPRRARRRRSSGCTAAPAARRRPDTARLIQYLVNHGYVVLGINNRGSSGLRQDVLRGGRQEARARAAVGLRRREEVPAVARLRRSASASASSAAATAATWCSPRSRSSRDEFKVGVDIFGVAELDSHAREHSVVVGSAAHGALRGDGRSGEGSQDARGGLAAAARESDPQAAASSCRAPTIRACSTSESDEIVAAVKKNGVAAEYIVFDDEGHGFTKKANQIAGYSAVLRFLDQHSQGAV